MFKFAARLFTENGYTPSIAM